MSSTLCWRPIRPEKYESVSSATKFRLSRRLFDTDGSTGNGTVTMTTDDLEFLQGMIAAGDEEVARDCQELIDAIEKYGAIELWHQH